VAFIEGPHHWPGPAGGKRAGGRGRRVSLACSTLVSVSLYDVLKPEGKREKSGDTKRHRPTGTPEQRGKNGRDGAINAAQTQMEPKLKVATIPAPVEPQHRRLQRAPARWKPQQPLTPMERCVAGNGQQGPEGAGPSVESRFDHGRAVLPARVVIVTGS